jgi:hypothetical protein
MSKKFFIVAAVISMLAIPILVGYSNNSGAVDSAPTPNPVRRAPATQWEYKVVRFDIRSQHTRGEVMAHTEAQLNQLGLEGWELVSCSGVNNEHYLKRPKH